MSMAADSTFVRHVKIVVPVLSVALLAAFLLASWSFYNSHRQVCQGRTVTLDVLRDVVVIATTPSAAQHLSQEQEQRRQAFRAAVFARIDQARC